jgi:iron complex outermembrane recepter protein
MMFAKFSCKPIKPQISNVARPATSSGTSVSSTSPTSDDRVTLKVIDNILGTGLPIRLSFSQFQTNPFQHGCSTALTAAPGCATVNLFPNGFSNPTVPDTAEEAKLGRHDRRTIVGGRWEHDFNNSTTWRTQIVFDDKNINQPTRQRAQARARRATDRCRRS